LKNSYSDLKEMLEEGGMDMKEQAQVISALNQNRQHHAYPHAAPGDATQR
jgi:hypothetical protein